MCAGFVHNQAPRKDALCDGCADVHKHVDTGSLVTHAGGRAFLCNLQFFVPKEVAERRHNDLRRDKSLWTAVSSSAFETWDEGFLWSVPNTCKDGALCRLWGCQFLKSKTAPCKNSHGNDACLTWDCNLCFWVWIFFSSKTLLSLNFKDMSCKEVCLLLVFYMEGRSGSLVEYSIPSNYCFMLTNIFLKRTEINFSQPLFTSAFASCFEGYFPKKL